jgi:hypothetical protein
LASGSPVLFTGSVALAALAIAVHTKSVSPTEASIPSWPLWVGVIVGFVLLLFQMLAEYRKRTYDPTWAIKFGDIFSSKEMRCSRYKAAKALKDNQPKLGHDYYRCADIDAVLDFLEDLGFYMQGDQLTPEVAHHAFHHWIRGYYSAARNYLVAAQKTEPSKWEFVKMLFETTDEIEREKVKDHHKIFLKDAELTKLLDEEIGLIQSQ